MGAELDICVDDGATCPIAIDEIERICNYVLEAEDVERTCFVSVTVTGEERIRELNRDWRGQDRATDVVSLECERPDDADLAPGEPCELGDIVLAPTYIERQAERFGTTPADEFRLLLVHGMLHLLGYDHLAEEEAVVMERREDELVAKFATGEMGGVQTTRHRDDEP